MNSVNKPKEILRKEIAEEKKRYASGELLCMSEEVFSVLEITGVFHDAQNICIYNSMPDEVSTKEFINRWCGQKKFYLPVIENDRIVLRQLKEDTNFIKSKIGVYEPQGENFTDCEKLDLIIVPGVAFDRKGNRLGRGKGYYDGFLKQIKATKVGVCFDFQLKDDIPHDERDIKMDMIVSENDLIW